MAYTAWYIVSDTIQSGPLNASTDWLLFARLEITTIGNIVTIGNTLVLLFYITGIAALAVGYQ